MVTCQFITTALAAVLTVLLLLGHQAVATNKGHNGGRLSLAAQFLGPHNAARSALRLPLVSWDRRLASYAKKYGRRRRADCALVHSDGPYGENLFWGSGGGAGWTPGQAVAAWAAEQRRYRYSTNSCSGGGECGHYTQMVWRNTRRLGCAVVACAGGRGELVVCEYSPPGNYVGERPY